MKKSDDINWVAVMTAAFIPVPVFALRIPADVRGQTEALRPYFIPFS